MDSEQLRNIIKKQENVKIEFKQDFFNFYKNDGNTRKLKDELIKDILSIANGNVNEVGESGYLLYGVSNKADNDGNRALFDVEKELPTSHDLIQLVNSACSPHLADISCESILIDYKRIFVFRIPSSPFVHELTRELVTPKKSISRGAVIIRKNEQVSTATGDERRELERAKNKHFSSQNISIPRLAFVVGGIATGLFYWSIKERITPTTTNSYWDIILVFVSSGLLSGALAKLILDFTDVRMRWTHYSKRKRFFGILLFIALIIAIYFFTIRIY